MPNPPGKPVEVGWICEVCPKGVPKAEVPNDGAAGVVEEEEEEEALFPPLKPLLNFFSAASPTPAAEALEGASPPALVAEVLNRPVLRLFADEDDEEEAEGASTGLAEVF